MQEYQFINSANKLYKYLLDNHWDGEKLLGPDCGVRFNRRVFRYIKSFASIIDWDDNYYYLQAQAYWIFSNLLLWKRSGDKQYFEIAKQCALTISESQQEDGSWIFPHPGWKGRITTVEGTWAAMGMLFVYEADPSLAVLLKAVLRWYDFVQNVTKFQTYKDGLAVNYFANVGKSITPNNTPILLAFLGRLAEVTGNTEYLNDCSKFVKFMKIVQWDNGLIPYTIKNEQGEGRERIYFQCYQYHAFQLQHLAMYYEASKDKEVLSIIKLIANFIEKSVRSNGSTKFDSHNTKQLTYYHNMAIASSLGIARRLGVHNAYEAEMRAFKYVMQFQRNNGSYPYSHDYFILRDNRAYPRTLSMMLYHLLIRLNETNSVHKS